MPKISVVMPVFNCEDSVERAIRSILNQSLSDFEFIILDDNSTDRTVFLIQSFDDQRIKLLRYKNNKGCTARLNNGIMHCSGEYIARMDGDDESFPDRFLDQVGVLERDLSVGLVGARSYLINQKNSDVGLSFHGDDWDIRQRFRYSNPLVHSSVMIRMSVLQKVGFYREDFKTSQDYELWWRIIDKTDFRFHITSRFLHARYHVQNSISELRYFEQVVSGYKIRSRYMNTAWNIVVTSYHLVIGILGRLVH